MLKILHRMNTIAQLKKIPAELGVEVDVRTHDGKLILSHEPFKDGDSLDEYLKVFSERGLAFAAIEVKEEGIERAIVALCKTHGITLKKYFLFGVSPPFTYRLLKKPGIRNVAVRFSEWESIETPLSLRKIFGKRAPGWIWVDTFTGNPLDKKSHARLKKAGYKICLVCPERWGRPRDIAKYAAQFRKGGFFPDAVMTSGECAEKWEAL